MSLMIDFRCRLSQDTLLQEVGTEAVLLNLTSQTYYALNAVGTRMLHLLIHSNTIDQAYTALCMEYDSDPGEIQADLQELIEKLIDQGLVSLD